MSNESLRPLRNLYHDPAMDQEITRKVPDYWLPLLEEKIAQIRQLQAEGGMNCTSFGMITDIHWSHNAQKSALLMEKIINDCAIPYFFDGGDTVASAPYADKEFIRKEFDECRRLFAPIEDRRLMVMGNHDGVYSDMDEPNSYSQNLTKAERFEYFFRPQTRFSNRTFGGDDGSYYYADDAFQKVRYIVLNTHDIPSDEADEQGFAVNNSFRNFEIREAQINWFAHVALDVPSPDWSVILCTHENITSNIAAKHAGDNSLTRNHALLVGIINAFRKHQKFEAETSFEDKPWCNAKVSVDFSGRGGDFIVWVSGHVHADMIADDHGIVAVSTDSDSCGWASGVKAPYKLGTTWEHLFDIFTVNKNTHTVHITRISSIGSDREFTYETFPVK